jgi:hypothetical protein
MISRRRFMQAASALVAGLGSIRGFAKHTDTPEPFHPSQLFENGESGFYFDGVEGYEYANGVLTRFISNQEAQDLEIFAAERFGVE